MITVTCGCGERFQVADDAAGRPATCPACGRVLRVGGDDEDWPEVVAIGPPGTSRKAVASLIFGLLAFPCNILAGIPAIILGALGLREIKNSDGRLSGQGLAITGIVTGSIGSLLVFPALLIGLLLPTVQKVRSAANRMHSANNLKMIGLALLNYENTHRTLPPPVVYDAQGKPLYSWRVLLLPYLEEEALFRQFKLDEPWDSPHNLPLLSRMPRVYQHASTHKLGDTTTVYQVFVGKGAMFETDPQSSSPRPLPSPPFPKDVFARGLLTRIADIRDGASNTIMVIEAANPVPWTKPDDLVFSPDQPLPPLGVPEFPVVNVLLGDGSVRGVPKSVKESVWRPAITRNAGDIVNLP